MESRWFDYDVNYLDIQSDIYVYDFIKKFIEHKEELPLLQTVYLKDILNSIEEKKHKRTLFKEKVSVISNVKFLTVEKMIC